MNVLFTQIAAVTGLFVFINQMLTYASIEKSVFLSLLSGVAVYLVLVVGDFAIRAILDIKPPHPPGQEQSAPPRQSAEREREPAAHTNA